MIIGFTQVDMIKKFNTKNFGIVEIELPFEKDKLVEYKKKFYGRDYNPRWQHYDFYAQYTEKYSAENLQPEKGQTKEHFIRCYGKKEGTERYKSYKAKLKKRGTLQWYKEKFGEEEGIVKYKEKNKKLSVGVESLRLNGYTDEEIKNIKKTHSEKSALTIENYINKYGEELGLEKYKSMVNNRVSCYTQTYWIGRGYTKKEAENKVSEIQKHDKSFFIIKYGEEEGIVRFKKMCLRRSFSLSIDGFIERYGKEKGVCLWEKYRKLRCMDKDGFIRVYGKKEGIVRYKRRNELIKNTYEKFVRVHGENADVKWQEYLEKLSEHLNSLCKKSMIETECLDALERDLGITILRHNKFFLYSEEIEMLEQKIIFPDGVVREYKTVIEFDGDAVHGNPRFYTGDQKNMFNRVFEDVWRKDKLKDKIYEKRGYACFRIWEYDYRNNYTEVLKKIKTFLCEADK